MHFSFSRSSFSYNRRRSLSPARPLSPSIRPVISSDSSLQQIRESTLIQRFNDLYARERLNAMDILRTISADYDMNQRICFTVVQEAFSVAKRRFTEWKLRLRSQLAITHIGPSTLEDSVQDYINRNVDHYELESLVSVRITWFFFNEFIEKNFFEGNHG